MKILVYGSCVSRDMVTHLQGCGHSLLGYIARQSLISAESNADVSLLDPERFQSDFQLRSVRSDFQGTLFQELDSKLDQADVILWDLIDERRGILALEDGSYVTNNWELEDNKQLPLLGRYREIKLGSPEHLVLWKRAFRRFVDYLNSRCALHKLILVPPVFATECDDGTALKSLDEGGIHDPLWLRGAYAQYSAEIATSAEIKCLGVEDHEVKASSRHRWGIAAYHYSPATERRIVREIERSLPLASLTAREHANLLSCRDDVAASIWAKGDEVDFSASYDGVPLNARIVVKDDAAGLLALFNGAVDLNRAGSKPVFQRSSWSSELPGNQIFISDGTVDMFPEINIGWGMGGKGLLSNLLATGAVWGANEKISRLASGGGTSSTPRLYGSSAGGFQALAVGSYLPYSDVRVMVNNPQIDWLKYEGRSAVRNAIKYAFAGEPEADFRSRHETIVDLKQLWRFLGKVPSITYLLNSASAADVKFQFRPFLEFLSNLPSGVMASFELKKYYRSAEGHGPLPNDESKRLIREWFERTPVSID